MARVNHGFARNFLVPNKLAVVVPQLRRRRGSTGADEAAAEQQRQQQVAAAASPGQQTLEKQQQQFDKLLKTLTGSTLVGGLGMRASESLCSFWRFSCFQQAVSGDTWNWQRGRMKEWARMQQPVEQCRRQQPQREAGRFLATLIMWSLPCSTADAQAANHGWPGTRAGIDGAGHQRWVWREGPCCL